jgi:hypothetical protein
LKPSRLIGHGISEVSLFTTAAAFVASTARAFGGTGSHFFTPERIHLVESDVARSIDIPFEWQRW